MSDQTSPPAQDENHLIAERRQKLAEWRASGKAYPNDFSRENTAGKLDEVYGEKSAEDLEALTLNPVDSPVGCAFTDLHLGGSGLLAASWMADDGTRAGVTLVHLRARWQRHLGILFVLGAALAWSTAGFFTRVVAADLWTMLVWRGGLGGECGFVAGAEQVRQPQRQAVDDQAGVRGGVDLQRASWLLAPEAGALRVLDCAYAPLRLDGTPWPAAAPGVWQLWTPNKALGLTGVRAAYTLAPDAEAAGRFAALAPSWPVGAHGVALLAVWQQASVQRWLAECLPQLRTWKARQQALCTTLGWQELPGSTANFFCARPPQAHLPQRLAALRAAGIKLRAKVRQTSGNASDTPETAASTSPTQSRFQTPYLETPACLGLWLTGQGDMRPPWAWIRAGM